MLLWVPLQTKTLITSLSTRDTNWLTGKSLSTDFQFLTHSQECWSHQIDWTADVTVHQQYQAVHQITGKQIRHSNRETLKSFSTNSHFLLHTMVILFIIVVHAATASSLRCQWHKNNIYQNQDPLHTFLNNTTKSQKRLRVYSQASSSVRLSWQAAQWCFETNVRVKVTRFSSEYLARP